MVVAIFFHKVGQNNFGNKIPLLQHLDKTWENKTTQKIKSIKTFANERQVVLKFVYSEKATKFGETSTLLLSTVHTDKSEVEISKNVVAFSEYMNFYQ